MLKADTLVTSEEASDASPASGMPDADSHEQKAAFFG
jgi:hypothetical protein